MARFSAKLGFFVNEEREPGVFLADFTVVDVVGYINNSNASLNQNDLNSMINEEPRLEGVFSILLTPFIFANIVNLRYLEYYGNKYKVTNIQIKRPRLEIRIGGLYNDPIGNS